MGQNDFIWIIGVIVVVGAVVGILAILKRPTRKLLNLSKKMTTTEVNNEKAIQMIGLLMSVKSMPKKTAFWDSIKTALKLVEQSGDVDVDLKQKLRTLLQGLNVQRFQPEDQR
jgi:cytochrome c-type biogenesis protein CcmE